MGDRNVQIAVTASDDASGKLEKVGKAIDDLGKSGRQFGQGFQNGFTQAGASLNTIDAALQKMSGIPVIGQGVAQLGGAFHAAGAAASGAGAAASVAWGPVVLVIGAVLAVAAAVGAAFFAAGAAIQQSARWANTVDDIQDVTGASAEMASTFAVAGQAVGVSGDQMAQSLGVLARNEYQAGKAAEEFGVKTGDAFARAGQQLEQLAEDHSRNIAEAVQSAAERVADLHQQAGQRADDSRREQAQRQSDFNAAMADSARQLNEQMTEMAEQHADRVSGLQQSMSDAEVNYTQGRADRERRLSDQLSDLTASFEQRRESLRERYKRPMSAREREALEEEMAALGAQEGAEKKKATERARREEARAKQEQDRKLAQIQAQIERENAQYEKQTSKLKEENARREADSRSRFERETADAQRSYDRQAAAAIEMEARIAAERDKRLADMERQFQRASANVQASMASAGGGGGGGGGAKAVDPFVQALGDLGVAFEDYQRMSPDQKLETLARKFADLPDGARKTALEMQLFGRSGRELNDLLNVVASDGIEKWTQRARDMGLVMDEAGIEKSKQMQIELSLMRMAFQGVGNTIGQALTPLLTTLLEMFNQFWSEHGPAVIEAIKKIGVWLEENLPKAIQAAANFWNNTLKPAFESIGAFIRDTLVPAFQSVAKWLEENLPKAIQTLSDFWNTKLLPAIKEVWKFISEKVIPIFNSIKGALESGIKLAIGVAITAFDALKRTLEQVFKAVHDVWDKVANFLQPVFKEVDRIARDTIGKALTWLKDSVIDPLIKSFDFTKIGEFFDGLKRKFDEALQSLPDWVKKLLGVEPAVFTPVISYAGGGTTYGQPENYFGRASGGPVWPNTPYLVGERGPEMVTFGRSGYVNDAESTRRAMSGAMGGGWNGTSGGTRGGARGGTRGDASAPFIVQVQIDGRTIAQAVVDHGADAMAFGARRRL